MSDSLTASTKADTPVEKEIIAPADDSVAVKERTAATKDHKKSKDVKKTGNKIEKTYQVV